MKRLTDAFVAIFLFLLITAFGLLFYALFTEPSNNLLTSGGRIAGSAFALTGFFGGLAAAFTYLEDNWR